MLIACDSEQNQYTMNGPAMALISCAYYALRDGENTQISFYKKCTNVEN